MIFRADNGWRQSSTRRRVPGHPLLLEMLEGRLVPALDISLSSLTFAEGLLGGEVIGTFSVTGETAPQKFSYSLVQGAGATDNGRFQVVNNQLFIDPFAGVFKAGSTYSVLVKATGALGETAEEVFQLTAKSDLVVTTAQDLVDSGDGLLSLREALLAANANPDHDRITVAPALGGPTLALALMGTTLEGSAALVVETAVSLDGGVNRARIKLADQAPEMRLFTVTAGGNLRLERFDLSGGVSRGNAVSPDGRGGAVLAHGPFSMFNGSISGARAFGLDGTQPGDALGGAIYSDSDLQLFQSTISGNAAIPGTGTNEAGIISGQSSGGGIHLGPGVLGVRNVNLGFATVAGNSAGTGSGLTIQAADATNGPPISFIVTNSVLADNAGGADIDRVGGTGVVTMSATGSFAETTGAALANAGFQGGDPLLGPAETFQGSRLHRPVAGSPLIGFVTANGGFTDQTGLQRNYPTAAGAAEYFAPATDIFLSATAFPAVFPAAVPVGSLSAFGPNAGFSFIYTLVPGALDNDRFALQGNQLSTATGASFVAGNTYQVRVKAVGPTGLAFEKDISLLAKPDIVVDTISDTTDPADGKTTLREAVALAAQSPGLDRISFAASLAGQTVLLAQDTAVDAALFITSDLLVSGASAPGLVIRPMAGVNTRVFQVAFGTGFGLESLTVSGGRAVDGRGGAIDAGSGSLFLDSVTLVDNVSSGNNAGGGAIYAASARVRITNSTFSNNRVEGATGTSVGTGSGGHLLVVAPITGTTPVAGDGVPTYRISTSTFDGGVATGSVGGVAFVSEALNQAGFVKVDGSVFANSSGFDFSISASAGSQEFLSAGSGNFVEAPGAVPGTMAFATGDAKLGSLAANGGATFTIAPLPGSPLLVAENPAPLVTIDQRGVTRSAPHGIGAYQPVVAKVLAAVPQTGPVGVGGVVEFLATFSHPVTVEGKPALALDIPGATALAVNAGKPGTQVVFRHTVAPGEVSPGVVPAIPSALDFAAGAILDPAGGRVVLTLPGLTGPPGPAVDGVIPSPIIGFSSPAPTSPSRAANYAAFADFGEGGLVGKLTPDDFVLENAKVSEIVAPDASGKAGYTISPISDGVVRFSLRAGALTDAAGNPSLASATTSIVSDRTAPVPVLSLAPAPGAGSKAAIFNGVLSFGESGLSSVSLSDFNLANAAIAGLLGPDAQGGYSFTLSPLADGTVFLSLKAGATSDLAGNPSKSSNVVSFVSDRSGPGATVVMAPAILDGPGGAKVIGFSLGLADPAGVDPASVTGAAVTITGPGKAEYPATLESFKDGVARFSVPLGIEPPAGDYKVALSGTIADSLGNLSQKAMIGTLPVGVVDTVAPELVSITRADAHNPSFLPTQRFLVSFSEVVAGLDRSDFTATASPGLASFVERVTLQDGTAVPARGAQTVVVVVSSSGLGTLELGMAAGATVADPAGNALAIVPETFQPETFTVDTTTLRIVSLGPVATPRDRPIDSIDIVLSKPVDDPDNVRAALALERNGRRFPLAPPLTITQTGYSSYKIDDFATQSGVAGEYSLRLDARLLQDPAQRAGTGAATVDWSAVSPIQTDAFNPVYTPPRPDSPDPFVIGVPKRVLLGVFRDLSGGEIGDYSARVNWGDGGGAIPFAQLENAEILPASNPGFFEVFGTHTYTLDRTYLINVLIQDNSPGSVPLLGLVESSSVVVTAQQFEKLNADLFVRGDVTDSTLSLTLQRPGQTAPALQATFTQDPTTTGAERTLYLANYVANPQQASVSVANSSLKNINFLDLRVSGADSETGIVESLFSFVATARQQVKLFYFNSATGAYEPVLSSQGATPVVNRLTGQVEVVFNATSTPGIDGLNETVFAVAVATPTPATVDGSSGVANTASVVSAVRSTLVQASQTLSAMERSSQSLADSGAADAGTGLFVGGRSSTLALTPSGLGVSAPARMRSSAGGRIVMSSSRDAAMALRGLLEGAIAPMERKLKPLMEALGISIGDEPGDGTSEKPARDLPPVPPEKPRNEGPKSENDGEGAFPEGAEGAAATIRAIDAALAAEGALGPWALAGTLLLALTHVREKRPGRKNQEIGWRDWPAA